MLADSSTPRAVRQFLANVNIQQEEEKQMLFSDQKRKPYRNKKILAAARDEPCLVNLPGCTGGGSDTQPAHSNCSDDGKGKGQKADDIFVAFACHHCHNILDGRAKLRKQAHLSAKRTIDMAVTEDEIKWYHDRGIKRTIRRLIDKGVIK